MLDKIKKQPKIIFVAIGIVVLFGLIGGGYYYWWTGTPKYSIYQIKKAIETRDKELGLKYVDVDAIFENLWTDMKSEITKEAMEAEGFEGIGAVLGLQLVENMKPALKEEFRKGIESWFLPPTEEPEEITDTEEDLGGVWQKDIEVKKQDGFAYIETPDGIKLIFTQKEGARYWVLTKIEGLTKDLLTPEKSGQEKQDDYVWIKKNIGDTVELATIKFKVIKSGERQTISSKYGTPKVAKERAKFVVIDLELTNITDAPFYFSNSDSFAIFDDKERLFAEYEDTIGGIDNYLTQRKLSPDITERGVFVYEIPQDAESYSLTIGKLGTNEAYEVLLK